MADLVCPRFPYRRTCVSDGHTRRDGAIRQSVELAAALLENAAEVYNYHRDQDESDGREQELSGSGLAPFHSPAISPKALAKRMLAAMNSM